MTDGANYMFDKDGGMIFPRNPMEYHMEVRYFIFKDIHGRLYCATEPGLDLVEFDELPNRVQETLTKLWGASNN